MSIDDLGDPGPKAKLAAVSMALLTLDAGITDPGLRVAWKLINSTILDAAVEAMVEECRKPEPTPESTPPPPTPPPLLSNDTEISPAITIKLSLGAAPQIVKIGKLKSNHIIYDHESVARAHAVLERNDHVKGESWWVYDLGSVNGTKLNGKSIGIRATVQAYDVLEFGDCILELLP